MTIQFRSTRTDGSKGVWHDILTPDGYGRSWVAPDQGWIAIEFREKPEESGGWGEHVMTGEFRNPACICDGGASGFHTGDCPT